MSKLISSFLSNKSAAIICAILGFEIFFFYPYLFSDVLFAAPGDHRFNILITEHWFRFYSGKEGIKELSMFFPSTNALAYSDLNLIFGLFMIILKCFWGGISTYLASKIIFIGIHVVGSLGLFYFLNHHLKIKTLPCFLGLILFSYSNCYYAIIDQGYTQFITYSLIPFLLIFLFNFFNASKQNYRFMNALLGILLYVLIFYTSFYAAFFIFLYTLLFIIFYFIIDCSAIIPVVQFIKKHIMEYLVYAVLVIILLLPLVFFYMPAAIECGVHGRQLIPHFLDFLNTSEKHLLYGKFMAQMGLHRIMANDGFPFITMILFMICFLKVILLFIQNRHNLTIRLRLLLVGFLTCLSAFILLIEYKTGSGLWNILVLPIPGAEAIRYPCRYIGFQTIPSSILIACVLNEFLNTARGLMFQKILLCSLLLLLLVENIRINKPNWHYKHHENFINTIPVPPSSCKVIYALSSHKHNYNYHNLDMFEIANRFSLKTINGYSGRKPFFFSYFKLDKDAYYLEGIEAYIRHYKLKNVCGYDFDTKKWEIQK